MLLSREDRLISGNTLHCGGVGLHPRNRVSAGGYSAVLQDRPKKNTIERSNQTLEKGNKHANELNLDFLPADLVLPNI